MDKKDKKKKEDKKIADKNVKDNKSLGQFIMGEKLGEGMFGKVRLGTHILTGEKVAIKLLEKMKILEQADKVRVEREIRILKQMKHTNIIQLYSVIQTATTIYLVMEFSPGKELFEYIVNKRRLSENEACEFFQQVVSGVDYMHKNRICHRDLKPENMLLDSNRTIKIIDFGLSNNYGKNELLGTACGSPCYAAPEMIAGKKYQGIKVDTWSMGIILYAMVCGYLPFEDTNNDSLYKKILEGKFAVPSFVGQSCKDLIRRILTVDVDSRISVTEIREHPWFGIVSPYRVEGLLINSVVIPIDEEIVSKMAEMEFTKEEVRCSVLSNKHNHITTAYYLLVKSKCKREQPSISDLISNQYLDYIHDKKNLLTNYENDINIVVENLASSKGKFIDPERKEKKKKKKTNEDENEYGINNKEEEKQSTIENEKTDKSKNDNKPSASEITSPIINNKPSTKTSNKTSSNNVNSFKEDYKAESFNLKNLEKKTTLKSKEIEKKQKALNSINFKEEKTSNTNTTTLNREAAKEKSSNKNVVEVKTKSKPSGKKLNEVAKEVVKEESITNKSKSKNQSKKNQPNLSGQVKEEEDIQNHDFAYNGELSSPDKAPNEKESNFSFNKNAISEEKIKEEGDFQANPLLGINSLPKKAASSGGANPVNPLMGFGSAFGAKKSTGNAPIGQDIIPEEKKASLNNINIGGIPKPIGVSPILGFGSKFGSKKEPNNSITSSALDKINQLNSLNPNINKIVEEKAIVEAKKPEEKKPEEKKLVEIKPQQKQVKPIEIKPVDKKQEKKLDKPTTAIIKPKLDSNKTETSTTFNKIDQPRTTKAVKTVFSPKNVLSNFKEEKTIKQRNFSVKNHFDKNPLVKAFHAIKIPAANSIIPRSDQDKLLNIKERINQMKNSIKMPSVYEISSTPQKNVNRSVNPSHNRTFTYSNTEDNNSSTKKKIDVKKTNATSSYNSRLNTASNSTNNGVKSKFGATTKKLGERAVSTDFRKQSYYGKKKNFSPDKNISKAQIKEDKLEHASCDMLGLFFEDYQSLKERLKSVLHILNIKTIITQTAHSSFKCEKNQVKFELSIHHLDNVLSLQIKKKQGNSYTFKDLIINIIKRLNNISE